MDETEALRAELKHYKTQKGAIRDILGHIGGRSNRRRLAVINSVFLIVVVGLFLFDLLRHVMDWLPHVPPLLLVETALLLLSLKIIWMIHTQGKVEHFQFWILNSIEFQMNMFSRRMADLDKALRPAGKPSDTAASGGGSPSASE